MRFLVALILGLAVMFGLNVAVDFFAMERPWGSILMGVTVGVTMLIVLLVWEAVRPTPAKGDSAKSQRSEEDRAKARAERRARLAAEAGVSLEGVEGALPGSSASPAEADSTETGDASEESDAPEAGNASEGPDPSAARDGDGSEASETEADSETKAAPETEASDADASATGAETGADEPDTDEKASGLEEPVDADEKSPVEDPDEAERAETEDSAATEREAGSEDADSTRSAPVVPESGTPGTTDLPAPPPMPPTLPPRPDTAPDAARDSAAAQTDSRETTDEAKDAPEAETGRQFADEPATLDPEDFDETAGGSSLENPPAGEPGMSADALEGHEPDGADETDDAAEEVEASPRSEQKDSTDGKEQYRL